MTLHMFIGLKYGNSPKSLPVYRQNSRGKLLLLRKIRPRRWEYVELSEQLEEEVARKLKSMGNSGPMWCDRGRA